MIIAHLSYYLLSASQKTLMKQVNVHPADDYVPLLLLCSGPVNTSHCPL